MIKSFRSKALKRYWTKGDASGLRADHVQRISNRLSTLDLATRPEDMNLPGFKFHALSGKMAGRYAVSITGNWRLTFAWSENGPDAVDVDYEDYH